MRRERLLRLMAAQGREARSDARVYLTGGASAVLLEWRASTIDVDLEINPVADEVLRALPRLKEELEINVELASPVTSSRSSRDGKTAARSSRKKDVLPFITTTFARRRWRRSSARTRGTSATSARWVARATRLPVVAADESRTSAAELAATERG